MTDIRDEIQLHHDKDELAGVLGIIGTQWESLEKRYEGLFQGDIRFINESEIEGITKAECLAIGLKRLAEKFQLEDFMNLCEAIAAMGSDFKMEDLENIVEEVPTNVTGGIAGYPTMLFPRIQKRKTLGESINLEDYK